MEKPETMKINGDNVAEIVEDILILIESKNKAGKGTYAEVFCAFEMVKSTYTINATLGFASAMGAMANDTSNN